MRFGRLTYNVRYAIRALRAAPGFTAVALTMLALGIGANTAIFSVVSAVLLRPLPFREPDRLVLVWEDFTGLGGSTRTEASPADFVEWKARNRSFADVATFAADQYNLTGAGDPEKLSGVRTTANLFNVLGMPALIGRTLTASDDRPDAPPVVVIDERVWRSRFGADPSMVGRTIHLNGLARTVVGIVPADFPFPDKRVSLWVPAQFTPTELEPRATYFMYVIARLKPDVSLAQAQADMTGVARALAREFPQANGRVGVTVSALHEHLTRDARPAVAVLLAAVLIVLLIAGANLANLLLTRGSLRAQEIAVRQALGATRRRVVGQLLTENAVLAGIGAALGVALAASALTFLTRLIPSGLPDTTTPTLDARVLLFTIGIAVLVVLGFGTGPAFTATRVNLAAGMKSTRFTTRRSTHLRSGLVVAELMLSVLLLIAAGLLLRSYDRVLGVDPGFNPHNLLIAETVLPPSKYARTETRTAFYSDVVQRVKRLPGVIDASFANFPPFVFKGGRAYITAEGEPPPTPAEFSKFIAIDRSVTPGYFRTLGVPLVKGREFEERDAESSMPTAIINQKMANQHWPGQDPIGRKMKIGPATSPGPWMTVVGVVANIHQIALDAPIEGELYLSANRGQNNLPPFLWPQYLLVRTTHDPLALASSVRKTVWSVDAEQSVSSIRSMDEIFDRELANRSTQLTLVAAFAVLAFAMAAIGLYGVLSYSIAQQLRDIGVKMALGASRLTVVREVVAGAMTLSTIGVALGLGAAVALTPLLRRWLFEVSPGDVMTFALTAVLLLVTAAVASAAPAARGASVDPSSVLRAE